MNHLTVDFNKLSSRISNWSSYTWVFLKLRVRMISRFILTLFVSRFSLFLFLSYGSFHHYFGLMRILFLNFRFLISLTLFLHCWLSLLLMASLRRPLLFLILLPYVFRFIFDLYTTEFAFILLNIFLLILIFNISFPTLCWNISYWSCYTPLRRQKRFLFLLSGL
jgi:hypothetical protein